MGRHSAPDTEENLNSTEHPVIEISVGLANSDELFETIHQLLTLSDGLVGDTADANKEYVRGQHELIADYIGVWKDTIPVLTRLARKLSPAELGSVLRLSMDGMR